MIRTAACRTMTKLGSESLGLSRQNYFAASTIMMTASSNSSHFDKPALARHGLRNDFCSPRRLVSTSSSGGGGGGTDGTDGTDGGGTEKKTKSPHKVTYVHPLSQIILEHFQGERSDWIRENKLERGLTIQEDGSFVLVFPQDEDTKEAPGKIWTSYEAKEKKHWLTVHRGELVGRFLLQDNLKPAWHDDPRSTPVRVRAAVEQLIARLDENK
eukprot:scaffold535582_cov55-Attheya_sp.AAC.2